MNNINPTKAFPIEWVFVTPEMAEAWLKQNEGNRKKRAGHIDRLVRDLKSGNFLPTGDSIKFDWNGNLIDGQHRLSSIVTAGVGMWIVVVRQLDPRVRGVLDTNAKRSGADALHFAGFDSWNIVAAAVAKIALSRDAGRLQTSTDTSHVSPTNIEITDWADANPDVAHATQFSGKYYKDLGMPPSILAYAVMILSRISYEDCLEFFTSAAEQRTNGLGDPRLTMSKAFSSFAKNNRGTIPNAAALSIIFRAWNDWRSGKKKSAYPLASHGGGISIPDPK